MFSLSRIKQLKFAVAVVDVCTLGIPRPMNWPRIWDRSGLTGRTSHHIRQ